MWAQRPGVPLGTPWVHWFITGQLWDLGAGTELRLNAGTHLNLCSNHNGKTLRVATSDRADIWDVSANRAVVDWLCTSAYSSPSLPHSGEDWSYTSGVVLKYFISASVGSGVPFLFTDFLPESICCYGCKVPLESARYFFRDLVSIVLAP